jgi:hypothetical protein
MQEKEIGYKGFAPCEKEAEKYFRIFAAPNTKPSFM